MASIFKGLLDIFSADKKGNGSTSGGNRRHMNKVLYEDLGACFENNLENLSVGSRMIYPMSYTILMHQNDYDEVRDSLGLVLAEVVKSFYSIIEKHRSTYSNYAPPARYWFFNISGCSQERIPINDKGDFIEIKQGGFLPMAHLFTQDIDSVSTTTVESSVRVSMRVNNSNVFSNVNINQSIMSGFDALAEGVFKFPFDDKLSKDSQKIYEDSNISEMKGYAELSYQKDGKLYRYTMKDTLIHISGRNERRNSRDIFKLESDTIRDSHVDIKYDMADKKFYLAAYGTARLNSGKVEESSGGTIKWYPLANNSSIFINDELKVKFEIK